jgi:hypothetical protein
MNQKSTKSRLLMLVSISLLTMMIPFRVVCQNSLPKSRQANTQCVICKELESDPKLRRSVDEVLQKYPIVLRQKNHLDTLSTAQATEIKYLTTDLQKCSTDKTKEENRKRGWRGAAIVATIVSIILGIS